MSDGKWRASDGTHHDTMYDRDFHDKQVYGREQPSQWSENNSSSKNSSSEYQRMPDDPNRFKFAEQTAEEKARSASNRGEKEREKQALSILYNGNTLFDKGDYAGAVAKYIEAAQVKPLPRIVRQRSEAYIMLGDLEKAMFDANGLVNHEKIAPNFQTRARVHSASGNFKEAIMDLNRALEVAKTEKYKSLNGATSEHIAEYENDLVLAKMEVRYCPLEREKREREEYKHRVEVATAKKKSKLVRNIIILAILAFALYKIVPRFLNSEPKSAVVTEQEIETPTTSTATTTKATTTKTPTAQQTDKQTYILNPKPQAKWDTEVQDLYINRIIADQSNNKFYVILAGSDGGSGAYGPFWNFLDEIVLTNLDNPSQKWKPTGRGEDASFSKATNGIYLIFEGVSGSRFSLIGQHNIIFKEINIK
jgi:tetratricopeptide (TPR) repeat protein